MGAVRGLGFGMHTDQAQCLPGGGSDGQFQRWFGETDGVGIPVGIDICMIDAVKTRRIHLPPLIKRVAFGIVPHAQFGGIKQQGDFLFGIAGITDNRLAGAQVEMCCKTFKRGYGGSFSLGIRGFDHHHCIGIKRREYSA